MYIPYIMLNNLNYLKKQSRQHLDFCGVWKSESEDGKHGRLQ